MSMSSEFPKSPYPKGWAAIAYSHEIEPGGVKAIKNFGENMVLFRGESGKLSLQDAYCLHLGANRAVRGWVEGDELVCPWHGWKWSAEGRNTCIPYKNEKPKGALKIRTYTIQEWHGVVMMWWDNKYGTEPEWELPYVEWLDERDDFYPIWPHGSFHWKLKGHVQMPVENAADFAHIHFVHGSKEPAEPINLLFKDHMFIADVDVVYGGGKEPTELTPGGETIAGFRIEHYGMMATVIRWGDKLWPSVMVPLFTPIDENYYEYRVLIRSKRGEGETGDVPQGKAARFLKMQYKVAEDDYFTWENMKVLDRANFAQSEIKNYGRLRYWATQFYPETEADYKGFEDENFGVERAL